MATERDIQSDITLEIDGELPSPHQLAAAITAFSALLNSAQRKCDEKASVKWGVQVSKGSNLLGYFPKTPINPLAISMIENGLHSLENGSEFPTGFDESMLYNIQTLCEIGKSRKGKNIAVKAWFNKKPIGINASIRANVDIALEGAFSEYGAIEGRLEVLDVHDALEFAIYEPLHSKRIACTVSEQQVFDSAYKLYEQRVEAEGMIKYTGKGIPYEIKVERLHPIVPLQGVQDYKLTRGILRVWSLD